MIDLSLRVPQIAAAAVATIAVAGIVSLVFRRKLARPEDVERRRRLQLVKTGRLVDGNIVDAQRVSTAESGEPQEQRFIVYQYAIAGVTYECSQDVTLLRGVVDLDTVPVGYPCTVRYQPRNPLNSIVVAEIWSGLHDEVHLTPARSHS